MSEKTLRELRTIWTVATCEILDAHIKSVVASVLAEREPAKPDAEPIGSVRYYEQQLENLRQGIDKLAKERDSYRELFNDAVAHVDGVFQVDSKNPAPLLPDFLPLGANKFEGVKQLAMAYIAATTNRIDALKERDAAVAEVERLKEANGGIERLRYIAKERGGKRVYGRFFWRDRAEQYCRECLNGGELVDAVTGESLPISCGELPRVYDAEQPTSPPSPAPAATGEDELRAAVFAAVNSRYPIQDPEVNLKSTERIFTAIRPLFDAVRAERDEWKRNYLDFAEGEPAKNRKALMNKAFDDCRQLRQRAEAAEAERDKLAAELGEVRAACDKFGTQVFRLMFTEPPQYRVGLEPDGERFSNVLDAILAAWRATKGKEQADA